MKGKIIQIAVGSGWEGQPDAIYALTDKGIIYTKYGWSDPWEEMSNRVVDEPVTNHTNI